MMTDPVAIVIVDLTEVLPMGKAAVVPVVVDDTKIKETIGGSLIRMFGIDAMKRLVGIVGGIAGMTAEMMGVEVPDTADNQICCTFGRIHLVSDGIVACCISNANEEESRYDQGILAFEFRRFYLYRCKEPLVAYQVLDTW